MTTGKSISKEIKGGTSAVRQHAAAFDRAREIYLANIKRAEADYFERIKAASALLVDAAESAASTAESTPVQPATDGQPTA